MRSRSPDVANHDEVYMYVRLSIKFRCGVLTEFLVDWGLAFQHTTHTEKERANAQPTLFWSVFCGLAITQFLLTNLSLLKFNYHTVHWTSQLKVLQLDRIGVRLIDETMLRKLCEYKSIYTCTWLSQSGAGVAGVFALLFYLYLLAKRV